VVAVPSGIDIRTFRPVPDARGRLLERLRLPDGPPDRYLLYVGTEIPRKNLGTLLGALRRLPPTVRLLKAGGPGHPRFRRATERLIGELGVADRVVLIDEVSEEELVSLYSAADAYVCCSFLEGFGHPVLEAMACGTPVVSSDAASLPEVVGEAGLLVPPADEDRLVAAIEALLGDPGLRTRLVGAGLDRAAAFSWQRTAEGVVAVYERVLAGDVG
jgi:glycosyltransferase involved in cell wall biosynthesis